MPSGSNTKRRGKREVIWSFCNACGQETKHAKLMVVDRRRAEDVDEFTIEFGTQWIVMQCAGCEEVFLSKQDWCSEDGTDNHGQRVPREKVYFPPRSSRRKPDWMERLSMSEADQGLLDEIYIALHADSRRLAVMGARALIDAFIQRKVGDQNTFKAGLDALVREKFLGEKQRELLEVAVDVGSASGHRSHNPDQHSVATVMDIVENLIHDELLREEKDELRSKTPTRSKQQQDQKKAKA
ncbi:MAG: hypothetical protein H6Q00_916 [Holophagaceae bacterium]|nr:hypothetical protein [Holophagaceae bacterium]